MMQPPPLSTDAACLPPIASAPPLPTETQSGPYHQRLGVGRRRLANLLCCCVLLAVGLVIGLHHLTQSGPLWPDAPRYANAAAMIHDWLASGRLLHPYEFARQNYCQYPAFNLPFHPPAYPALLAVF